MPGTPGEKRGLIKRLIDHFRVPTFQDFLDASTENLRERPVAMACPVCKAQVPIAKTCPKCGARLGHKPVDKRV